MKNLCSFDIFYPITKEEYRVPAFTGKLPPSIIAFHQFAQKLGCTPGDFVGVDEAATTLIDRCKQGGLRVSVYDASGRKVRTEPLGTFHLIETDNFGGDYPNESFVAKDIEGLEVAKVLADAMNAKYCDHPDARRYYKPVLDGYKLQPGFEP